MGGNEEMRQFIDGISAAAEISLLFYRAAITAGANQVEAVKTTQAYMSALLYGGGGMGQPPETPPGEAPAKSEGPGK